MKPTKAPPGEAHDPVTCHDTTGRYHCTMCGACTDYNGCKTCKKNLEALNGND